MGNRIAIIPARGGSKRIPNKNTREFCGKPIISYVIESARASRLFDVVHVSTDSEHIRETVESLGIPVDFMRPIELAGDHTPLMPVLKYVVNTYGERGRSFDQVWLLMACAPLIDATDLQGAAKLFDQFGGQRPLLSVAEYPVPIEWAFRRAEDGALTPAQPGMFAVRSQDLERKYFDTGSFAVFPADVVSAAQGAGSDDAFISYILPKMKAVDIDDEADWVLAEAMYMSSNKRRRA